MTFSLNEEGAIPYINRVTTYTTDYYFCCINMKFLSEFDVIGKNINYLRLTSKDITRNNYRIINILLKAMFDNTQLANDIATKL